MGLAPRSPCYYLSTAPWDFLAFHIVALRMNALQRLTLQPSVLDIWSVHLPVLPFTEGKAEGSGFGACAHALTVSKVSGLPPECCWSVCLERGLCMERKRRRVLSVKVLVFSGEKLLP